MQMEPAGKQLTGEGTKQQLSTVDAMGTLCVITTLKVDFYLLNICSLQACNCINLWVVSEKKKSKTAIVLFRDESIKKKK